MGLISGVLTAAISLGGYSYMVQASDGLGGVWEMIMGQALVPVSAVWSTIIRTASSAVPLWVVWAVCSPSAST